MAIYIISFIIVGIACNNLQNKYDKIAAGISSLKYKWLFLYILCVFPLVLLAALRGEDVGKDTVTYIYLFEEGKKYTDFWNFFNDQKEQLIYSMFLYFFSHFIGSVRLFFGFLQIMALLPLFKLALIKSKDIKLWEVVIIYCLWFFNDSLNGVRQAIAVGFLMLFYESIKEKKLKAIMYFLVAIGFHSSAIIFVVVYLILSYIKRISRKSHIISLIALGALLLGAIQGIRIVQFLLNMGIVPMRYILYINTFLYHNSRVYEAWTHISPLVYFESLVKITIILSALIATRKKNVNNRDNMSEYLYNYSIGAIVYLVGVIVYHTSMVSRATVYFDSFLYVLLPVINKNSKVKIKIGHLEIGLYTVIFSSFYWIFHVAIINSGWTIPYMLNIK